MLTDDQVKVLLEAAGKVKPMLKMPSNIELDRDDVTVKWNAGSNVYHVSVQLHHFVYVEGYGMTVDEAVEAALKPVPDWLQKVSEEGDEG